MLRQYELSQNENRLICWLPADSRLRSGVRVTLKGLDGVWNISTVYKHQRHPDELRFGRGWNNNI